MIVGRVYYHVKNYSKAKYHWLFILNSKEASMKLKSVALNNLGDLYAFEGELNQAIVLYKKSLTLKRVFNDDFGIALAHINLGNTYFMMDKLDSSLLYIDSAYSYSSQTKTKYLEAYACIYYGNILFKKTFYSEANKMYRKGLLLAKKTKNTEPELDAYIGLYNVFSQTSILDSAIYYQTNYFELYKHVNDIKNKNTTHYSELDYLIENKNNEIIILTTTNENKSLKNYLLVLCIIIIILIALTTVTTIYQRSLKLKALRIADKLKIEKVEFQLKRKEELNKLQKEDLEQKNRELSTTTLYLLSKNEILDSIKQKLTIEDSIQNKPIIKEIEGSLNLDGDLGSI